MLNFKEKPIIGMVHVRPLPGSPNFSGKIDEVVDVALRDAKALEKGGVDAILVENFWDIPYRKEPNDPETIASMTLVVQKIKETVKIPVGVNLLRNGAIQALAIAYVTNSSFIRVNILTEAYVTDQGIIEGRADELSRYKKALGAENIAVLADVHVKYAQPLFKRSLGESAKDLVERGKADAVIVSGRRTGTPPSLEELREVKNAVRAPVIIGSGLNLDNVKDLLIAADGAIVGSYFKEDGDISKPVDANRVLKFMEAVRKIRRELL